MKLTKVKIFNNVFVSGHRYWWMAELRYGNKCIEITQSHPLSMTHDDAISHARDLAIRIDAKIEEQEGGET